MTDQTRNSEVLADFVAYCQANPTMRFWQALRNWSGYHNIIAETILPDSSRSLKDTFHWEGKTGEKE